MLASAITLDSIWQARNLVLHGGKSLEALEIIRSIKRRYVPHKEASEHKEVCGGWSPPKTDVLKINFDAAVKNGTLFVTTVCRSSIGEVISICTNMFSGSQPFKGKALAGSSGICAMYDLHRQGRDF